MKEFDYYIFIDYSENLIGYNIIDKFRSNEILPKIGKFAHYSELRYKESYLSSIKKRIEKDNLYNYLLKYKIKNLYFNLDIFLEVVEFLKDHKNCAIFISLDDHHYESFIKFVGLVLDRTDILIIRESKLKKDSKEYKLSLIIDTMLNLERAKQKHDNSK